MKVMYGSDLHLEFQKKEEQTPVVPECDLLLLAGDVFCPWSMSSSDKLIFENFMENVSKNAKQTLMVMGNHEHYNGVFLDTANKVREFLSPYKNVRLLENEMYQVEDVLVFGSTFWTDMRGSHPEVMWACQRNMSDYTVIKYSLDRYNPYNCRGVKLRAEDTVNENFYARGKLREFMTKAEERGLKPIVLTHMAPSYDSCTDVQYKHDDVSFAYANTGMDDFLFDFPKHKWVFGHMHDRKEGKVGNCEWMINARGYVGYENHQHVSSFEFKELVWE